MSRLRTALVTALVTATATAAVSALTAIAPAPSSAAAEAWQPVTQASFTAPAGRYCSFAFTYQPTYQDLESRVLGRYPDGSVRAIEYRGPLVGTTTNDTTGASISRDSSGTAVEQYRRDGTLAAYTSKGTVGLGFTASDHYPQGYYQLGGVHRVKFAPDGTKTVVVDRGPEENICLTLA